MVRYDIRVLNQLLDAYERSVLSRGENKVAVRISFTFTRKTMPEYFNESSSEYEEIHAAMAELERMGFLSVVWKDGKKNYIIRKVILCPDNVQEAYRYAGRVPKAAEEERALRILKELKEQYNTPAAEAFTDYLVRRIEAGKSVREYTELSDTQRLQDLVRAVSKIEENDDELYIREFSIRYFGDSKRFEELLGVVGKALRSFGRRGAEKPDGAGKAKEADREEKPEAVQDKTDVYGLLAEYGIYHTPNYVQMKGAVRICVEEERRSDSHNPEGAWLELSGLRQGIGISGEDLKHIRVECSGAVKKLITIENLTTYYRWSEPDSVVVYLGGYHNRVRRRLLRMFYEQAPEMEYLHFGDMDVGGFEIYQDLCRKTGIPFKPYHMGVEELKRYQAYTKPLTENDRKRLGVLLEHMQTEGKAGDVPVLASISASEPDGRESCKRVLEYMKEHGVKLEQECIGNI